MRVFALSDIHVDYESNATWIANVSISDYRGDVLILAGDVTDNLTLLGWCVTMLAKRFWKVLFVPGNHDLWVIRDGRYKTSIEKFREVTSIVESSGASMRSFRESNLFIAPLLGWYDYSFGEPSGELKLMWMDYQACRWPNTFGVREVTAYFTTMNEEHSSIVGDTVITFSHFLPRIDLMPNYIPASNRVLYPVLGTTQLERQLRRLNSSIHIYGHSHINRNVKMGGVTYINNAFGYPQETWMKSKQFLCVYET
jgi:Icc-related predicted phosphoesterase